MEHVSRLRGDLPTVSGLSTTKPEVANHPPPSARLMSKMSSFSAKGLLGELEQLVMLATLRLGDDAYAVSIRDEIEARTKIALGRSSIYVTLDRLDRKGYVTSWFADPTPERGGKAKRCFAVTPAGRRALAAAESAVERLRTASPARPSR